MKKTTRLGMGLSALMGDLQTPGLPSVARILPISVLEPSPFQARRAPDPARLAELVASIRQHGVLQPLLVRPKAGDPGKFQILAGERRWRAAQQAGLHDLPVVVREVDDRTALAAGLVENLQREDLNAVEEAEGYQRLIEEFGLKQEELAQLIGKSRSHIANTLRLLTLPSRLKEMLREGQLSAGHARALLGAKDPHALADLVLQRGLSVRQTEALAAAAPRDPAARRESRNDPDIIALERRLTERLGLKVAIRSSGRGGHITIAYRDLDQLEGLLRLLDPEAQ